MNPRLSSKFTMSLVLALSLGVSYAAKPTLEEVTDKARKEASKAPDEAAAIVKKFVAETPEYACPIIKAVIEGAKTTSKEENGELVAVAIRTAPEKTPEIRACLPADMLGGDGKSPVSKGKEPVGKEPIAQEEEEWIIDPITGQLILDPYGKPIGPGSDGGSVVSGGIPGVYLTPPAGNGNPTPDGDGGIGVVVDPPGGGGGGGTGGGGTPISPG